jgi:hypothetical protein
MKTNMKSVYLYRCVLSCLLVTLLALPAWPQASTTTVSGTVRDPERAVIVGAAITLTNTATGVISRTTTNEVGFYIFAGVVPGFYRLSAEAPGMRKFEATLTVQVQQAAVIDAVLNIGETQMTVEIQDVTPLLTSTNPTLGHGLERQRIEQLPINGRFIGALLQTVPGMEGNRAFGLREGSTEYVVDGASISDRLWGSGHFRRPPGLDTVQEFRVENNNSSAKYNRPTTVVLSTRSGTNDFHGAVFETHRNNSFGKARQRQDFYSKPPQLIRNEFGASAGGPIRIPWVYNGRDRSFWFFAYEGFRNVRSSTSSGSVPTEAMRNGDFSGLVDSQGRQFRIYDPLTTDPQTWQRQQISYRGQPNVIDPSRLSPLGKYLLSITPLPTHPNVNPLVESNWFGPSPFTQQQWTITARIDHQFSAKDQAYLRFTKGDDNQFRYPFGGVITTDRVAGSAYNTAPNSATALSWVRTFSPTFFNDLLLSFSHEGWTDTTGEPGVKYADQIGTPNPFNVPGWPGLYETGLRNYIFETGNPQGSAFTHFILDNNSTNILGRHELQFGFHYRYDWLNYLPDQQHPQGNHNWGTLATALYDATSSPSNPLPVPLTGHNLANMFLGSMNYSNQLVRNYFYMRAKEYALYFQDNFKVSSRLILNLGLRWDYWPPYTEKNNILSGFDPERKAVVLSHDLDTMYRLGATLPSVVDRWRSLGVNFISYQEAGLPRNLVHPNQHNFGPRLGLAYRVGDGARSFVIRGGYRISYFPIPFFTWGQRMRQNIPFTARFRNALNDPALSPDGVSNYNMRSVQTVFSGQNSRDAVRLSDAGGLARGANLMSYFDPHQPDSRVHDWNLTLERQIMRNTLVRFSYVGNHTGRLDAYYRYNDNTPDYIWFVTRREPLPTGGLSNVLRRPFDQQVFGDVEEYRKTGWSNNQGIQLELERRYSRGFGFQVFYNMNNSLVAGGADGAPPTISELNLFLPGTVPTDIDERMRLLNYRRDISIPKHRVRWNWVADLPFGKGKWLGGKSDGLLNGIIGGWQVAGLGSLQSNYFSLPTNIWPTGNKIEIYGYQYPIQDCRSGACRPGYLWWNGYIPANRINSVDADGRPNGIMGVPSNYRPAGQPLIPAGSTTPPPNFPGGSLVPFWDTNTVWIPLNNGTVQRTNYNGNGLHPWQQQYFPGVWQWGLDASLFKTIHIKDRFEVRINADFFNVLNRPGNPNSIGGDGILSTFNSGQGAREMQLTVRLTW